MTTPDLKPCPFCGSKTPVLFESHGADRPYHILCECGGRVGWFDTAKACIEAWNRRANDEGNA